MLCLSAAIADRVPKLERELKAAHVAEQVSLFVGGRAVDAKTAEQLGARWGGVDLGTATKAILDATR